MEAWKGFQLLLASLILAFPFVLAAGEGAEVVQMNKDGERKYF